LISPRSACSSVNTPPVFGEALWALSLGLPAIRSCFAQPWETTTWTRLTPCVSLRSIVDGLHLEALGFKSATPKDTGRPPYQPGELLQLYIYGSLNKMRSSRT
jgi:hypothetical protein